jgi:hypothetical protein
MQEGGNAGITDREAWLQAARMRLLCAMPKLFGIDK